MKQIAKWLAFYAALLAALVGLLLAVLPSTGHVHQGASGMYLTAAVLLLAAAPGLALPFSVRASQGFFFAALSSFALGGLLVAFGSVTPAQPGLRFQAAATLFAILVAVRVGLSRRRKSTG